MSEDERDGLSAIRARRVMITPGEWDYFPNMAGNRHWSDITAENGLVLAEVQNHRHRDDHMIEISTANAEFIAHAPADIDMLLDIITHLRSDLAALEDAIGRTGDSLTNEWISLIDSAPPPTEPQALIWHKWCDQMLRDYAAACKKMAHGEG